MGKIKNKSFDQSLATAQPFCFCSASTPRGHDADGLRQQQQQPAYW